MKELKIRMDKQNAIRLLAKKGRSKDMFDIYISCDKSGFHYLMTRKQNNEIFKLLRNGISLRELREAARKMVSDIAVNGPQIWHQGKIMGRKQRRIYSQRIEDTVQYLILAACDYVRYEVYPEEYTATELKSA